MFLGLGGLALGCVEMALVVAGPQEPTGVLIAFILLSWAYLAAGLTAWWRRPGNRLGAIMVLGAAMWLAADLYNTQDRVLIAVGAVTATVPLAVAVHLLHAFPSGRLEGSAARLTVAGGYVVAVVLQAPLYLFQAFEAPYDLMLVADRPDLAAVGQRVQTAAGAVVVAVTIALLIRRLMQAAPARRRVLLPFFAYGIFAILINPLIVNVLQPLFQLGPATWVGLQLLVLAGLPTVFALGVVRGQFGAVKGTEELVARLGAIADVRPALVDVLAESLGDPTVELAFWVPDRQGYVDESGSAVELTIRGGERAAVVIDLADRRIGAIVVDPQLVADLELVRSAGRVVALAMDRERLTAELRASQEELRLSRARIVEASYLERRRVARDLHDGMQVRLFVLAVAAQELAQAHPSAGSAATALRVGIDSAASELRTIVQSIMPALLIERGLSAAIEDLVDQLPVPVSLDSDAAAGALAPVLESAAYFIVAEGLSNALKHAGAGHLAVRIRHTETALTVEVADDGVGGASLAAGSGLRGLADRADVLGGTLSVLSPVGHGTRLVAELPCGW